MRNKVYTLTEKPNEYENKNFVTLAEAGNYDGYGTYIEEKSIKSEELSMLFVTNNSEEEIIFHRTGRIIEHPIRKLMYKANLNGKEIEMTVYLQTFKSYVGNLLTKGKIYETSVNHEDQSDLMKKQGIFLIAHEK